MSDSNDKQPVLNPATAGMAVGLGLALAPFTGGSSLLIAAAHVGTFAAVDAATGGKTIDKN